MSTADNPLKRDLIRRALRLRAKRENVSPTVPRFFDVDEYRFEKQIYKRVRIILRSNGCCKPTCTMCPLPNEALSRITSTVRSEDYLQQVRQSLAAAPNCEMVCLYNDGSFFSNQELPTQAREGIYRLLTDYGCRVLMVESLPSFITEAQLQVARTNLPNVRLVVGIGLQSSSTEIRELCINSPVKEHEFLKAIQLLAAYGFSTKAYVMLKPPFLTEEEAIDDAVSTINWLHGQSVQDITLCPTRVAGGTIVSELFSRGLYYPPMLTSIGECLLRVDTLLRPPRVSIFNVHSSDFAAQTPGGCSDCESNLITQIEAYNLTPLALDPNAIVCRFCTQVARKNDPTEFHELSLGQRVTKYLTIAATPRISNYP
jgi:archaeosine synthase beta-subunit